MSLHDRKLLYGRKRQEIFSQPDINSVISVAPPDSIRGVRQRYKEWRKLEKCVAETTFDTPCDTRKYANVEIEGKMIEGLLDSGASITCLGKGGLHFIDSIKSKIKSIHSEVKTANGSPASIVGKFIASVKFRGVSKNLLIFVAPSLKQALYLGSNFWDTFNLWPEISEVSLDYSSPSENSHRLSIT